MNRIIYIAAAALLLTGCSIQRIDDTPSSTNQGVQPQSTGTASSASSATGRTQGAAQQNSSAFNDAERLAYEQGVQDVLMDMRSKMSVTQGHRFMPPIRECGIKVPGRVFNGAYVPAHETCVTIAPGHFVDEESLYLPEAN